MEKTLLCLVLMVPLICTLKQRREPSEWDYRSVAEKVNMRGCANLTTVLDNWKFAIMTQFRNLLLYDHHTVLPDYGRIKSLSEALDELYKEFNALKEHLGELSTKFEGVEVFVDEMNAGRQMAPPKSVPTVAQPARQPVASKETGLGLGVLTNQRKFKRPKAPVNQP
ncbi:uncharacterized protein LOC108700980 isoform X2 [Xenopus laevis]|nr:uncharacterized protein LOC108700980 isoform X2 [Xenopus laevis]XP_041432393.1 uncharacterized protein LOC108700980 isoform X2 [Xenopus laevis]XP_041432394.1 uncharacterized protein LOC108700980 isoform X2 [Xenopus laevis]XP_041432395.1 uncharacterized protein LOC108700980 isoform X2 [Xenopus laevis]XP_041432396.1 uncharacterized protein LOC108700980 isoform X2 [Xenopus laevis]XP_041432398.1 uncharacterized protein LOC108700980 isoform X2 [Xenopus laevis]OCT62605.1 hypothetical protein XEL